MVIGGFQLAAFTPRAAAFVAAAPLTSAAESAPPLTRAEWQMRDSQGQIAWLDQQSRARFGVGARELFKAPEGMQRFEQLAREWRTANPMPEGLAA